MIITRLELINFRSYPSLMLDFSPKNNVILGLNGSGKTNIVEAIYLLSLCKSWRNNDIRTLIRSGEDSAFIRAYVCEGAIRKTIEIFISQKEKKITIDGKPARRLSELSKLVNVIVFAPEDVNIFKSPPSARRRFLDIAISKKYPEYLSLVGEYSKILQERNAILKKENVDSTYLEVITNQLIAVSEPIIRYRKKYVAELNGILTEVANALYDSQRELHIDYHQFLELENFQTNAKKLYENNYSNDLFRKTTSKGAHREDFSLFLDREDISLYGSQGENRLAAIALKIAPFFLIDDMNKKPITILDDVYSELDEKRSEKLNCLLNKLGQVFITSAECSIEGDAIIDVSKNNATRRK